MKTLDELKQKLHGAQTLAEKIAIRIEIIEFNRSMQIPDKAIISPIATFLGNLNFNRTNLSYSGHI